MGTILQIDIFKFIFLYERIYILIHISLQYIPMWVVSTSGPFY